MPRSVPIDRHLDVGVVRTGSGISREVIRSLEPLVPHLSGAVGRVVDLTISGGSDGDRRWIELRCWFAGYATVTAWGSGPTDAQAAAAARKDLLQKVDALALAVA